MSNDFGAKTGTLKLLSHLNELLRGCLSGMTGDMKQLMYSSLKYLKLPVDIH